MNPQPRTRLRIGIDISVLQGISARRGMGHYSRRQVEAVTALHPEHDYMLFYQPGTKGSEIPADWAARPHVQLVRLDFPEARLRAPNRMEGLETFQAYTEALQRFVAPLALDVFHMTTMDDMLSYQTPRGWSHCPLVMTAYDLIPLIALDVLNELPIRRDPYVAGLEQFGHAAQVIAISEAVALDLVSHLSLDSSRIAVAPSYTSPVFRPLSPNEAGHTELLTQLGIDRPYVFAISHITDSKNLKRQLAAFSALPYTVHNSVQMVVTTGMERRFLPPDYLSLVEAMEARGQLVWTPPLTDDEVGELMRRATAYVHCSLFEGFGLPVLEAMQSGVPVITSDRGSMAEIAQGAALLVNPESVHAISRAIQQILSDEPLRSRLRAAGLLRATQYSPERMAQATVDAYERATARSSAPATAITLRTIRPRLAVWSPVPPVSIGIADYTAELLDHLRDAYEIEVFIDAKCEPAHDFAARYPVFPFTMFETRAQSDPFDVVIHQLVASAFHEFQLQSARTIPGIVVLHDMCMALPRYLLDHDTEQFEHDLLAEEGPEAVEEYRRLALGGSLTFEAFREFTSRHWMVGSLVEANYATVVHLPEAARILRERHPDALIEMVNAGVDDPHDTAGVVVAEARQALGLRDEDFVVGAFGQLDPSTHTEELIDSVARLHTTMPGTQLLVAGTELNAPYISQLHRHASRLGTAAHFVGTLSPQDFARALIAADVIVVLRWPAPWQMSAVLARAIAAGKPIILSDLPEWRFLPESFCQRVTDGETLTEQLTAALGRLAHDPALRAEQSAAARQYYLREGTSFHMALRYAEVINQVLARWPAASHAGTGVTALTSSVRGLQRTLQPVYNSFRRWQVEASRTEIRGFGRQLQRFGPVYHLFLMLVRMRNLGKVWAADAVRTQVLLDHLQTQNEAFAALVQHAADLTARVEALEIEQASIHPAPARKAESEPDRDSPAPTPQR